jgi:DNA-binding HxlR family transcriptional regulator
LTQSFLPFDSMTIRTGIKRAAQKCAIAAVAELVGDPWILLLIRDFTTGPKRFKDLMESLKGISTRTLTSKLKLLESRKIITRKVFRERPPRVEYTLTSQGHELTKITRDMRAYGEKYLFKGKKPIH